jgi:hypothetical protein
MHENHSTLFDSTTLRAGNMVPSTISSKPVVSTTAGHADKENVGHETAIQTISKRKGYLSWDDYFLAVAFLSSKRSKDPKSPSGACIVDQKNRIVGEYMIYVSYRWETTCSTTCVLLYCLARYWIQRISSWVFRFSLSLERRSRERLVALQRSLHLSVGIERHFKQMHERCCRWLYLCHGISQQ